MNQILLTENQNSKRPEKKYNNNMPDMKRIMMIFGIILLIFACFMIGVSIFKTSNKKKKEVIIEKPTIVLEKVDTQVKIIIDSEVGINKITYKWNDDEAVELEKNGVTDYEESLDIPEGSSTLYVKVVDQNLQESEITEEFYIEENKDKAEISINETVGNGKIEIIVTDEINGIKSIKYKWNDEKEKTLDIFEEGQFTIKRTIDVKRGQNTLHITAINGLDKETTLDKVIKGVYKPTIEVLKDNDFLIMNITHDKGFKRVEFTVNSQEYVYDESFADYNPQKVKLSYKIKLSEGENIVIIHAISLEETEETYKGKCNYKSE